MKLIHITIILIIFCSKSLFSQDIKHTNEKKINKLINQAQFFEKKNLDSSLYYYNKALAIKINPNDTLLARLHYKIGTTNILKGNYDIGLVSQLKALKIYENNPSNPGIIKVYNSIAILHFHLNDYDKALKYFRHTIDLLDHKFLNNINKTNKYKGKILNNIGIIYDNKNKIDLALEYYSKALTYSKTINDIENLSSVYSNMGIIYVKSKRYEMAEIIFKEALDLRTKQGNNNYGLSKSYYYLGRLYHEKNEIDKAQDYLLKSLDYSYRANSSSSKLSALKELGLVYAQQKNYKKAYEYQNQYQTLNDSLYNKENHQKIIKNIMQYDFEKETKATEESYRQKEIFYIGIAIFLLSIITIIVFLYKLQKTKAKVHLFDKEIAEICNKEFALREENLKKELEFKNKELTTNIIYLVKKNELIEEIINRLIILKNQSKKENQKIINKIIFDLKQSQDVDIWKEFEVRFNQVYNEFYDRLIKKHPDLTINEKRICAFLRLNMTSKEICTLTRQSYNSLNVARSRLRKKLNIQNEEINLVNFLENI